MGTLNIIDWCKENGNPKPTWEVRAESVVTTFLPSSFFATGKKPGEEAEETEKVRPDSRPVWKPESRPESLEDAVLDLLKKGPLSKSELSQTLGHKHISGALKKALISLLKQKKIGYTNPDKPNSRMQKYKLE
jgi:ATP-dependent DNA helicase RecG